MPQENNIDRLFRSRLREEPYPLRPSERVWQGVSVSRRAAAYQQRQHRAQRWLLYGLMISSMGLSAFVGSWLFDVGRPGHSELRLQSSTGASYAEVEPPQQDEQGLGEEAYLLPLRRAQAREPEACPWRLPPRLLYRGKAPDLTQARLAASLMKGIFCKRRPSENAAPGLARQESGQSLPKEALALRGDRSRPDFSQAIRQVRSSKGSSSPSPRAQSPSPSSGPTGDRAQPSTGGSHAERLALLEGHKLARLDQAGPSFERFDALLRDETSPFDTSAAASSTHGKQRWELLLEGGVGSLQPHWQALNEEGLGGAAEKRRQAEQFQQARQARMRLAFAFSPRWKATAGLQWTEWRSRSDFTLENVSVDTTIQVSQGTVHFPWQDPAQFVDRDTIVQRDTSLREVASTNHYRLLQLPLSLAYEFLQMGRWEAEAELGVLLSLWQSADGWVPGPDAAEAAVALSETAPRMSHECYGALGLAYRIQPAWTLHARAQYRQQVRAQRYESLGLQRHFQSTSLQLGLGYSF